jgi:hypothetical protein
VRFRRHCSFELTQKSSKQLAAVDVTTLAVRTQLARIYDSLRRLAAQHVELAGTARSGRTIAGTASVDEAWGHQQLEVLFE